MNSFVNAVQNQEARTENYMKARESSANPCVDLFYNIAASRDKNVIPSFVAAFIHNKELAIRTALWARDARGGAGERKVFKDILAWLDANDPEIVSRVLARIPDLGRWDDIFASKNSREVAFDMVKRALITGNGLAAKWMPRKGVDAEALRNYLGFSPKRYRKTLVTLTKVVEQEMCAREWEQINYNHVPSVAAARYQKAFTKHDPVRYAEWKEGLKGEVKTSKVNAAVLYPYDVLRSVRAGDAEVALAQWEALPNYMGNASILPLIDVSGSMTAPINKKGKVTCLDVAVSLGLYCADKNRGAFKDMFLTFSAYPKLLHLEGDLLQKICQIETSKWEMNTNLHAAFEKILKTAIDGNVSQEEMPKTLLIFSDMQFDYCVKYDHSAIEMIRHKYTNAGYTIPQVVFWNLNAAYGNMPVRYDETGTALVSGFSPSLVTSIIGSKEFTPQAIMLETIMKERYTF